MNKKISKWLAFAALMMFAGATFLITGDRYVPGAICFLAAAGFVYAAKAYRKKENGENPEEAGDR
ncbi:MAG: hypothetical protein IKE31_12440 [Eubacterium sp.]|nr:hypothetical protein [Eubacterium sp.]